MKSIYAPLSLAERQAREFYTNWAGGIAKQSRHVTSVTAGARDLAGEAPG